MRVMMPVAAKPCTWTRKAASWAAFRVQRLICVGYFPLPFSCSDQIARPCVAA